MIDDRHYLHSTMEEDFVKHQIDRKKMVVYEEEFLEIMKELYVGKPIGPDRVPGWILKEWAKQSVAPIHSITKSVS